MDEFNLQENKEIQQSATYDEVFKDTTEAHEFDWLKDGAFAEQQHITSQEEKLSQKENLEKYFVISEEGQIEKLERAADKGDVFAKRSSKVGNHRKESSRKSKAKSAAAYMREADAKMKNYRSAKAMANEEDTGAESREWDLAKEGLEALDAKLKAMRYEAEFKAVDGVDEEIKKAEAEIKIRGAQLELINRVWIRLTSSMILYVSRKEPGHKKRKFDTTT